VRDKKEKIASYERKQLQPSAREKERMVKSDKKMETLIQVNEIIGTKSLDKTVSASSSCLVTDHPMNDHLLSNPS